jgi:hypothetical protein
VPCAEADLQPAVGEHIGGGDLAGQQARVPERRIEDEGAHAQPLRGGRRGDQGREGRGAAEMIGGEHGVVARALTAAADVEELRPRAEAEDVVREAEVTHAGHAATITVRAQRRSRSAYPAL